MRITQKRRRDHPFSRSPSDSTSKTGSRTALDGFRVIRPFHNRYIEVTTWLQLSVDGVRRPLRPCRRVPIGLLLLPAWAATVADVCMSDRHETTGQRDDEILHELVLVALVHFTIDVTLMQAAARACECGILTKPLKSLLVGRFNRSRGLCVCLWSSRGSRRGDLLAAQRWWLHGSCSSRCANAVCKPGCL
jgi:hypothetical protein